jgi:hypothetical protein
MSRYVSSVHGWGLLECVERRLRYLQDVGTLPAKSLFPQDGAGARMTARHEIALMNLRKR